MRQSHYVIAPGRVNLIGEHIDYHNLPVLPIAIERRVRIEYRPRTDALIRAKSADGYGAREFEWAADLTPVAAGDWENYLRAAAQAVGGKWGAAHGIDATVSSDLPPAAGLSSSSALIVAVTLALLRSNGREASFEELMEILPDGEQFVGTRGGGMDHAASLGSRAGCASLIRFAPLSLRPIPVPASWTFLVAHSLTTAEKSGGAREEYNVRRAAGHAALRRLGYPSYRQAIVNQTNGELEATARRLGSEAERDSFLHVAGEALRVEAAVRAMEGDDAPAFGRLLFESHASLRDKLRVSNAALDRLVEAARASGALGARLTGAGFGGCAVVFCLRRDLDHVRRGLVESFYAGHDEFDPQVHLIHAEPGPGALHCGVTE